MAQQNRRQVSIRSSDWQKASQLRDEVSRTHGRKVTITDTIASALVCLEGSLAEPPPLWRPSPEEEKWERYRDEIINLLGQFIARMMPERRLRKVTLDPATDQGGITLIVVQLDSQEVPLYTGSFASESPVRTAADERFLRKSAAILSYEGEHHPYVE